MGGRSRVALLGILLFVSWAGSALADSAEVLPKGVVTAVLNTNFYFSVEERFNREGNKESVAADLNANLNSTVFPLLAPLDPFTGGPGTATIGRSNVVFKYDFTIVELTLGYGITNKLTFGVKIPYWWVKNNVNAHVDTSSATVGKNPLFSDDGSAGPPIIPIAAGGTPLTDDDVQNLLGGGLDVNNNGTVDISGFGFKRVETWSDDGFADIEAGLKYQYLKSDNWRLAFTGGIRFPTGSTDDPDNLVDYARGSGAYAFGIRLHNDYIGLKNWVFSAQFKYDHALPYKKEVRVVDPREPIGNIKERVDRELGDILELEVSTQYSFWEGFGISALYNFGTKMKDKVSGSLPVDYSVLEKDTDYTEHIYIVGLSYSTIPRYLQKSFPIPLNISLSYRDRFAGNNFILNSQYIGLMVQTYF